MRLFCACLSMCVYIRACFLLADLPEGLEDVRVLDEVPVRPLHHDLVVLDGLAAGLDAPGCQVARLLDRAVEP